MFNISSELTLHLAVPSFLSLWIMALDEPYLSICCAGDKEFYHMSLANDYVYSLTALLQLRDPNDNCRRVFDRPFDQSFYPPGIVEPA